MPSGWESAGRARVRLKADLRENPYDRRLAARPAQVTPIALPDVLTDDHLVEVVVEVGDWDHTCCGPAYERHQVVTLGCLRTLTPQGQPTLTETRHHLEAEVVVSGRVVDIQVQRPGGQAESIQRLPSGRALRGFDPDDDGHLEQAWTEMPLPPGESFLLTLQVQDG